MFSNYIVNKTIQNIQLKQLNVKENVQIGIFGTIIFILVPRSFWLICSLFINSYYFINKEKDLGMLSI